MNVVVARITAFCTGILEISVNCVPQSPFLAGAVINQYMCILLLYAIMVFTCFYTWHIHPTYVYIYRSCILNIFGTTEGVPDTQATFWSFLHLQCNPSCHYLKKNLSTQCGHTWEVNHPQRRTSAPWRSCMELASQDVDCQVSVLFVRRFAHAIFSTIIYKHI